MRWIAHIDMNAYFASVEEMVNPKIRGKPILVTGAPEGRSVVCTASYPAREYGIQSGMSLKEALRLCPHAVVVTGNPSRYTATLSQLVKMLEGFTHLIEIASVDEVYMNVSDIVGEGGKERAKELAGELRMAVVNGLDLPCSVGIAPNKVMAKFASGLKKPMGETVIAHNEIEEVLENLPVDALPGIGTKLAIRLKGLGITTCGELGRAPVGLLKARFGVVGIALKAMGQGVADTPLVPYYEVPEAKSVGHSVTLPEDIYDMERVKGVVFSLSEKVGRRMRRRGYRGRRVQAVVRRGDFTSVVKHRTLKRPTDDAREIYKTAVGLIEGIGIDERGVRMLGVSVSLIEIGGEILPLFEGGMRERALIEALDAVNDRYGEFTVSWARAYLSRYRLWHVPMSRRPAELVGN
ncbi:MAG: DNA polymerase IV [Candidatus Coatesbacteria bacterium]|nr:MAG: DNA polymerase IV [Candidatus Coatesbacteria bacterium]